MLHRPQFSLKVLLCITTFICSYYAGRMPQQRRAEKAEREVSRVQRALNAAEQRRLLDIARLHGIDLYGDNFAADLRETIDRKGVPAGLSIDEIWEHLSVEVERLPKFELLGDSFEFQLLLSPSYILAVRSHPAAASRIVIHKWGSEDGDALRMWIGDGKLDVLKD